ncbi:LysR family transcriptional regulator [Streptococcus panodentis]|uniref:LysR family transcriptional regulator n=1 Tax=Streptococcus panodentis TaxID=1581472 RepID=A0ABS5AXZ7_9STRE|nr:LysR family transcriptional regulator [Streptococcus panodentis]MBP2621458.1 LysR family transcriptional regulator [Streptococcus panodentis]
MNSRQLECFIHLAETLNFNATARLVYISQPAVSHQIKSLEEELGLQLFLRNKRRVELTPAGQSFYQDMREIYPKLTAAVSKAKSQGKFFTDSLVIAYEGNEKEQVWMAEVIAHYHRQFPSLRLFLKNLDYKSSKKSLLNQELDLIFTVSENIQAYSEIQFQELFQEQFVCVFRKDHPLSRQEQLCLEQLQQESLVFLDPLNTPPELAQVQNRIEHSLTEPQIYYADSAQIAQAMILGGVGLAVMPRFAVQHSDRLQAIPVKDLPALSYGIAWHKQNPKDISSFSQEIAFIFER